MMGRVRRDLNDPNQGRVSQRIRGGKDRRTAALRLRVFTVIATIKSVYLRRPISLRNSPAVSGGVLSNRADQHLRRNAEFLVQSPDHADREFALAVQNLCDARA